MKYSKWIGLVAVLMVLIACFMAWIVVPAEHLVIGGLHASGPHNFGKPGLLNIFCSVFAAVFFLLPRIGAKRANIFFCGFNVAWAIRNFILLSRCYGGDCPVKQPGLYLLVAATILMLLMSFNPDVDVNEKTASTPQQP